MEEREEGREMEEGGNNGKERINLAWSAKALFIYNEDNLIRYY